jgi:acyl dehydratase
MISLITEEARALIGVESTKRPAAVPVSEEMLRRFHQAVMESNPVHWDHDVAAASKYGEVVATPLFPLHGNRRAPGDPDPFDRLKGDPDQDGTFMAGSSTGLPPIELPLKRLLNGGTEAEFFRLARVGDVISSTSKYLDITERESRDGSPMVIIRIATTYTNQDDEVLAVITTSVIRR